MSWLQWTANWLVTFLIIVFLTCLTFYLMDRTKTLALEVINYYLEKKKAIIAELEKQMEDEGKKRSVRSYDN